MSQQMQKTDGTDLALEPIIHSWSGAVASSLSTLLFYPLENIKTRIQSFYELTKKILKADPKNIGQNMMASSLAGMFSCLGTNPFWVINTRLTFAKNNENFAKILVDMIKNEGISSLYKGLQASLFLVTNPLVQFTVYEFLKTKITGFDKKFSFILFFLAGAISKAIATIVTFPPQLLRTYQHMDKKSQNKGYVKLIKDILEQDGFQGLFRGLQPKFIQSVSNSAFLLFFYELIYKVMKKIIFSLKHVPAQAIKK
ncbi:Mitochondrial carrier domain [Pseudocohnilembus persalinus]|uniref:Mitochondrial carrier domain n=1 Tax=Pseudocohnilembus persalinus TaxID=266149 RepID=A0A0V0QPP6_PSEPJ|nr:Mitochondrial carrier domain [Pseudocohnilembus persalinus]|eukprot:KRX04371.1 Mitochondrial carrier domain [Pseudocohnilembus persalinus]